jgi:predicted ester cyclase
VSSPVSVEALVRRFYDEAWNAWDDGAVEDLLAPDVRFRGSLGDEVVGHEGFRAYRDRVRRAVPDFANEIVELVAATDRAAARLRYSGHQEGPLLGRMGYGQPIAYEGAAFFTIVGGCIATVWVLGDLDGLRRQLR